MKLRISGPVWGSGGNLFVSAPRPEFFFGAMMVAWLSGPSGKATKTTIYDVGESVAILLPEALIHREQLNLGAGFVGSISFRDFKPPRRLPSDLALALKAQELTFSRLSHAEQRQALLLLAESSDPDIRASRIEAIVAACRSADALKVRHETS